MIDVKHIPGTNIVEMVIEGKATAEEFEIAKKTLEDVIEQQGSVKILDIVGDIDIPPIPWSKFWEDIKFGFEHMSDITHMAVVADQDWVAGWVKSMAPLFDADMKMFKHSEVTAAREWLGRGKP